MDEEVVIEAIKTALYNHMQAQARTNELLVSIGEEIQACRDELVALNDVIVEVDSGSD